MKWPFSRRPPGPPTGGAGRILAILDACAARMTFPVLDNGYVYPAASRLTCYRSATDWALVIEVFGFSPRAGSPDVTTYTFASALRGRKGPEAYVSRAAYDKALVENPHNSMDTAFPFDDDAWQEPEDQEFVRAGASSARIRGRDVPLPSLDRLAAHGVALAEPPRVQVFEACRALAADHRELVLATPEERRAHVAPDLVEILRLEEWHHPDVAGDERPSAAHGFQQIAAVLETGDPGLYRPTEPPNTHWSHWPVGGTL